MFKVNLVDDRNGRLAFCLFKNFSVLLLKRLVVVKNRKHKLCIVKCLVRLVNSDAFHHIVTFTQTCRVTQMKNEVAEANALLNNVTGWALDLGINALVPAYKHIHQTAFADIRHTDNRRVNSVNHGLTVVIILKKLVKLALTFF